MSRATSIVSKAQEKAMKDTALIEKLRQSMRLCRSTLETSNLDSDLEVSLSSSHELSIIASGRDLMAQMFSLTKRNMFEIYEASNFNGIGWSDCEKLKELNNKDAMFFYVTKSNLTSEDPAGVTIAAFLHFRFEINRDCGYAIPVCYIWELQTEAKYRSCGIGRTLVSAVEDLGNRLGFKKILCTVQKTNPRALKFYTKCCGFIQDESSPSFSNVTDYAEYYILKKPLMSTGN